MTSDSVASFLDLARDQGLLPRDQVEDLFRQPDMPHSDLQALCDFLEKRGVLTPYQAGKIRSGQGQDLTFAGYPIVSEIGSCPGGTAFNALHPSLRTPLIVRRLRADWLAPSDNVSAYVQRAQAAAPVTHPNLTHLLDAGVSQDEAFVVIEPFDGGNLESLIADIGPMPAVLAADYARQIAQGLDAAHARGLAHGDVRPKNVLVGPIVASSRLREDGTPRMRPAPGATVKLSELGLLPHRSSTDEYAPPERSTEATPKAAGDVYMLGATVYYLLTGKTPAAAAPLTALRPDLPQAFAGFVAELMELKPEARPSIKYCVIALQALAKGQALPARNPDSEEVKLTALASADVELVEAEAVPMELVPAEHEPAPAEFADFDHESHTPAFAPAEMAWGQPAPGEFVPAALDASAYAAAPATQAPAAKKAVPAEGKPVKRANRKQMYIWIGVGLFLNLICAPIIWYFVIKTNTESEPEYNSPPPVTKKLQPKPNNPKKPQAGS